MDRIEYRFKDEQNLPAGPWDEEPDKVQWPDPTTGLACLIKRNPLGALCGYVGVDASHPWHGKGYDEVSVDAHGSLTYSGACDGDELHGICHVPGDGEPEPLWWFGFDCAHAWDLVPYALTMEHWPHDGGIYRDVSYVTAEVAKLAQQVAAAA